VFERGHFDLPLGQTERALQINPSDAESFATRGGILAWAGRAEKALPWIEGAYYLRLPSVEIPEGGPKPKVRNRSLIPRGTGSSNPFPSSTSLVRT
jgi:hypothetical protein